MLRTGRSTFAHLLEILYSSFGSLDSRGVRMEPTDSTDFDQNKVVGSAAKEMVRTLLESCGYSVLPFGYENVLAGVRPQIGDRKRFGGGDTVEKIRSMPDLLVMGEQDLHLVEVKFRAGSVRRGYQRIPLSNWELARYQKYWPEAILVVVSPFRDGFHAQNVTELAPIGGSDMVTEFSYDAFLPMDSVFKLASRGDFGSFAQGIENLRSLWDRFPGRRRYRNRRARD